MTRKNVMTEAQRRALEILAQSVYQHLSPDELGLTTHQCAGMVRRGLLRTVFLGYYNSRHPEYMLTDAGRAALDAARKEGA